MPPFPKTCSPEPQEFSPHPDSAPGSRRPLAAPRPAFPGGFRSSLTLTLYTARCPAYGFCLPPGAVQAETPAGHSAILASPRFRKAVEAAPPEAAAAGAGESRSRSQGAGASAPFSGCGVIHPARLGRAARISPRVSIPGISIWATPVSICLTRGSNTAKDRSQVPLLSPGPFIYIPSSLAANQNKEVATRSQSEIRGGSIARSLSFSNRRLGLETQL